MKFSSAKNFSIILLIAVSFILSGPLGAFGASKYKDYPCPKDCMDEVKKRRWEIIYL